MSDFKSNWEQAVDDENWQLAHDYEQAAKIATTLGNPAIEAATDRFQLPETPTIA